MDWKRVSALGLALAALFCRDAVWAQTAAQPRFGVTRPAQSQLSVKYAERTAWLGISDEETAAAEPAPTPAAAKTAVPTPALNAPSATIDLSNRILIFGQNTQDIDNITVQVVTYLQNYL